MRPASAARVAARRPGEMAIRKRTTARLSGGTRPTMLPTQPQAAASVASPPGPGRVPAIAAGHGSSCPRSPRTGAQRQIHD
jgi:hypothetical protein